jgi:molecular chaperone GrpE (heat shock protein)
VYKILESNAVIDVEDEEQKHEDDVFDNEEIDTLHNDYILKLKNKYDMKYNQIKQCYADLEIYKNEKNIECINIMSDLLEKNI